MGERIVLASLPAIGSNSDRKDLPMTDAPLAAGNGSAPQTEVVATSPTLQDFCRPNPAERMKAGRACRGAAPRSSHADWSPKQRNFDPLELLEKSNGTRIQELVPIRYGRMLHSPFTYLRGSPIVMAHDFATTVDSGLRVQICGDAHLMNFGLYASPERTLLFDVNDFDETLPGPWEWDVKRLAVSFVVAAREHNYRDRDGKDAAQTCARSYRENMRKYAEMPNLDVWYSRVDASMALQVFRPSERRSMQGVMDSAHQRNRLQALEHYTTVENDTLTIVERPPLVVRDTREDLPQMLKRLMSEYRVSLGDDRRTLIDRFRFVDYARKVVGVGSVGTRCYMMLLDAFHSADPLLLQVKEAEASILEPLLGKSAYHHHGRRVVAGQKLMQSASDIFLGWSTEGEHHYYFRQLRDMKGSANIELMSPANFSDYATLCGWVLARAHARAGDPAQISGYLGKAMTFDEAIAKFAVQYADQNQSDYEALQAAQRLGKINATMDL